MNANVKQQLHKITNIKKFNKNSNKKKTKPTSVQMLGKHLNK